MLTGRTSLHGFGARTACCLFGALCLFAALVSPAWAGTTAGRVGFSTDEVERLSAGELLRRPVLRSRAGRKLMGGTSYQVIDAPLEVVWQALLDTPRYPRMMPEVVEARLVSSKANHRTVFLRQGRAALLETAYYLDVDVDHESHDLSFRIDESRPHDLDSAVGFYNIRRFRGGARTLLSYGIMADIGGGLFAALARDSVHEWMLRTPWMVKRFIEGSGRHIYGTAN